MMTRLIAFCLLTSGLLFGTQAAAVAAVPSGAVSCSGPGSEKEEGIREAVEKRYQQIADLAAKFSQETFIAGSEEYKMSRGALSFSRPGKMDWTYEPPDEQRFTSDGSTVWWYQPNQNQVVVREMTQSFTSDVPVSFLLGVGSLRESFNFQSKCSNDFGIVLSLVPAKGNPSLVKFLLLVDRKDFSPLGAKMIDIGGNETSILFEDRVLNGGVNEKNFRFEIPKGTDVIDERKQTASKKGEK